MEVRSCPGAKGFCQAEVLECNDVGLHWNCPCPLEVWNSTVFSGVVSGAISAGTHTSRSGSGAARTVVALQVLCTDGQKLDTTIWCSHSAPCCQLATPARPKQPITIKDPPINSKQIFLPHVFSSDLTQTSSHQTTFPKRYVNPPAPLAFTSLRRSPR